MTWSCCFSARGTAARDSTPLLEAFPRLLRAQPRAKLLVVGYDSAGPRFERQAHKLGLGDRVRFLGGRRDAETCFAAADLYALPTHYDPFANSTLEALATGLPVITTAANGASELLTAGVEGTVLASPHDIEQARRRPRLLEHRRPRAPRRRAPRARWPSATRTRARRRPPRRFSKTSPPRCPGSLAEPLV